MPEPNTTALVVTLDEVKQLLTLLPDDHPLRQRVDEAGVVLSMVDQWRMTQSQVEHLATLLERIDPEKQGAYKQEISIRGERVGFRVDGVFFQTEQVADATTLVRFLEDVNASARLVQSWQLYLRSRQLERQNTILAAQLAQVQDKKDGQGQDGTDYRRLLERLEVEVKEAAAILDQHGVRPGILPIRLQAFIDESSAPEKNSCQPPAPPSARRSAVDVDFYGAD